jgi:hypothetical protein
MRMKKEQAIVACSRCDVIAVQEILCERSTKSAIHLADLLKPKLIDFW